MNFDKSRYKVYTWKNWMMLHWIINPGLAINELILGQRVPKVSLEDKTIDKPRIERTLIPCPHCNALHDGRTWSTQNGTAFKNWFGLYCMDCGGVIPCLTNALSIIVLVVTYPIWGWFRKGWKAKWLEKQPERYKDIDIEHIPNPFDKKNWIKTALQWGFFMFLFMEILFRYFIDGKEINLESILKGLIIWTISGLTFGYVMKLVNDRKLTIKNKEA